MILDTYISTRSTDALEGRIISRSPEHVIITDDKNRIIASSPRATWQDIYYFKFKWELSPGTFVKLKIAQEKGAPPILLESSTLEALPGERKVRFGILADPHLNAERSLLQSLFSAGRRLYSRANELCRTYLRHLADKGVDFIVLPGDIMDPGSRKNAGYALELFAECGVRCCPLIGNHEPYSMRPEVFYKAFDLPDGGYYAFDQGGVRFIMLSTPDLRSLDHGSEQLSWLEQELNEHASEKDVFIFSHFSLILHPCVQGPRNDGLQQLNNWREVLDLLKQYPRVRAFMAGHKNVPSRVVQDGISQILCPQLIQAPCCYDMVDVYNKGFIRTVHEIEEQHYVWASRQACGEDWQERFGSEEDRCFCVEY